MQRWVWLLPVLVSLVALGARADSVIVGYTDVGYYTLGGGVTNAYYPTGTPPSGTPSYTAMEFTLLGTTNVTHIDINLTTLIPDATFTASLQNGLTGSPTTYFTGSGVVAGVPNTFVLGWYSLPVNLTLGPGTYYLVIGSDVVSACCAPPFGPTASSGVETSNGGTAPNGVWRMGSNPWEFIPGTATNCTNATPCDFLAIGGISPTFAVYGSSDVPEPGTVTLLLLGGGVLARRRVKRSA